MRKYTTYDDYPKHIAEVLKRTNAWWNYDEATDTLTITNRNPEQPLTNSEKIDISKYLVIKKHAFKRVSFR